MTTSRLVPRHLLTATVLAATALLAAACGSSGGSSDGAAAPTVTQTVTVTPTPTSAGGAGSGTPSPTAAPSAPAGPGACATEALHVSVGPGDGAAGSVYYPIVFTNASSNPCTLLGFPGVSFVTGQDGSQIGDAATRNSDKPVKAVVLDPGGIAHATLQVVQALNFPAGKCQPVNAHFLKIFPPNQTAPVILAFSAKACAATGQGVTVLNVAPVSPGATDS